MDPIKEALTFDDVTLAPNYSEILPSETNTSIKLSKYLSNFADEAGMQYSKYNLEFFGLCKKCKSK